MSRLNVSLLRYIRKRSLARFETEFYGICRSFFRSLLVFCIDLRYLCQDMGENVFMPVLKPALRHSPFFFLVLCMLICVDRKYNCQDTNGKECSPALKTILRHSPFYFFSTLEVILSRSKEPLPRNGRKHSFCDFETQYYSIHCSIFSTLEVILSLMQVNVTNIRAKTFIHWF